MAAAAAAGGGGGSDGNGRPVRPHEQGMLNAKVRKRKAPQPRDREQSGSPDSAVTTCAAMTPAAASGGGGGGGSRDVEEVQQQANGNRPSTPAASSGGGVAAAQQQANGERPGTPVASSGGDHRVTEVQQQTNGKKPRLVWTTELHERFVRACRSVGREVVPKKILEAMKVNGLTRENVASHLQKYRQNMQGRGQGSSRRRGGGGGNRTVTMLHTAARSLQPAFPPQAQPPVAGAAFPQAPSSSVSVNPRPQGASFAVPSTIIPDQLQMGHVQLVQALPAAALVHHHHHQPRPEFPMLMQTPMPQPLIYQPPLFHRPAAMGQRHRIIMEHQARHAAPGHDHEMVASNYELGAQTLARAPAAGVQSHRLQPHMQGSQAVNMNGSDLVVGLCSVPEPNTRGGEQMMETRVGMAQLQIADEAQVPRAADPDGGQQEDSCDVLHFWNTDSAPSMDHEFPPNKPI